MKRVFRRLPFKPKKPITPPVLALRTVTSKSGKGVYASSDTLFKGAVFGRDSVEVAEDLNSVKPRLVRHILLTLASLQGQHSSDITEEEHGKIVHEYRTAIVDGKPLDDVSRHIFKELSSRWGGNDIEMAYYGSIDATPHFIRALCRYIDEHGRSFLDMTFERQDGSISTMRDSLIIAIDWLTEKLSDSSSGLLEYRARNVKGIENQVWKDSKEFYIHENGKLANHNLPIASIEVQGLVYDALMCAGNLLDERREELHNRARKFRNRTFELLWLPKKHFFALGIDHRDDNSLRIIKTITANPASLLDTSIFDDLPTEEKHSFIRGIVSNIMGSDFLTDAGIRSRSLNEHNLVKFWDYHGSFTSWPKESYDIAKGLRRQGFPKLATELENRILNVVKKSRSYPEFVYVDFRGRVLTGPPSSKEHDSMTLVESTNTPETIQAWTVSAVLAITNNRLPSLSKPKTHQTEWSIDLEKEVLSHIPRVPNLRWSKSLEARYPDYPYKLSKNIGRRTQQ
jgi:glycogen debranching enzyme